MDIQDNSEDEGLQLVENPTTEISYLVFNPKDPWAKKASVRKAIAQIVDRPALAHNIYKDTVEPLYSMIPRGLVGHTTGFFDDFGEPQRRQGQADPRGRRHHRAASRSPSGTRPTATAPRPSRPSRS